jgi:hypothetical protein
MTDNSSGHIGSNNSASEATSQSLRHLNQEKLARRWNVSPRTLEKFRWKRQGPQFLKIGGRVAYRLEDVEAYEAAHMHPISKS